MARTVRAHLFLLAISGATCAAPVPARDRSDQPLPRLAIEPIAALNLLAPADLEMKRPSPRLRLVDAERAGLVKPPPYRLEREGDLVTGKRAKLSVAVGDTRIFAVGGKLSRRERPGPPDPLDGRRTNALGQRKLESGRLYGGGLERAFGQVNLSAAYQYSRINGGRLDPTRNDAAMPIDNKNKSHSLLLNARLRF
jgi:hypothetical protein